LGSGSTDGRRLSHVDVDGRESLAIQRCFGPSLVISIVTEL